MTPQSSPNHPTETTNTSSVEPCPRRPPALNRLGTVVNERIGGPRGVQQRYLSAESSGRADLAALRRAAHMAPGELPAIWALTAIPTPVGASDAPTREEIAIHTAMTLYGIHQQSRTEPMHVRGEGLGHAARALIGPSDSENPSARARFNALVTSTTITELTHHLRGFVSQLRGQRIPLDYAALADDILRFQQLGKASSVRRTWARQYYVAPSHTNTSTTSNIDNKPQTPEEN